MHRSAIATPGVLRRIVESKQRELATLRPRTVELRAAAERAPVSPAFLESARSAPRVSVIAEVKRRSPSAGAIRPDVDVAAQAAQYAAGGAAAVSVLTDEPFFGGRLEDLELVRSAVSLPLLRKDFTLEPVHLWEARAAGASAILLIVRILEDGVLRELLALASSLSLSALVEVHTAPELERALAAGARLVGVNNRDLDSFTTDLSVTERLAAGVPPECVLVGESGIRTRADVERLARAGVDAVLVGEALMRGGDPAAAVRDFGSVERRARS